MASPNMLKLNQERAELRRGSIIVHSPVDGHSRAYLRKRARLLAKDIGLDWPEFKQLARENGGLRNLAVDPKA